MPMVHSLRPLCLHAMGIGILLSVWTGCDFRRASIPEEAFFQHTVKSIVVMGFVSVVSPGEEPGVVRDPLAGAVHMAEPIQEAVVEKMTENLFSKMVDTKRYEFISPGQARGAVANLLSSSPTLGEGEMFVGIGRALSADCVLAGYLYRWVEREGTDYAVSRPASVAFDIYLIRTSDGAILWKGRFDKSQISLTENLFDFSMFIKSKGKWMTAEALAEMGLNDLLERFPARSEEPGQEG